MDFQEKIDNVAELLNVETAPVQLLPVFCRWMGLDVSGDFLTEERMRTLVREAYQLNRTKGTKETLLRVCEIVLGEKFELARLARDGYLVAGFTSYIIPIL